MSANCCTPPPVAAVDPVYRRILWIALVANAAMFFVEIGASAFADSTALLADAVDFFGDAANYGISLAVLALLTNVGVAFMLVRYYGGDANMRSVWLCSRNDAIGNVAVIFAAFSDLSSLTPPLRAESIKATTSPLLMLPKTPAMLGCRTS